MSLKNSCTLSNESPEVVKVITMQFEFERNYIVRNDSTPVAIDNSTIPLEPFLISDENLFSNTVRTSFPPQFDSSASRITIDKSLFLETLYQQGDILGLILPESQETLPVVITNPVSEKPLGRERDETLRNATQALLTASSLVMPVLNGEEPAELLPIYERQAAMNVFAISREPMLLAEAAQRANLAPIHLQKDEVPTNLSYVTKRNFSTDRRLEVPYELQRVDTPLVLNVDIGKYAEVCLEQAKLGDFTQLEMPQLNKINSRLRINLSQVDHVEVDLRKRALAQNFIVNSEAAAATHFQPTINSVAMEQDTARHLSLYEGQEEFINDAVRLASEAKTQGLPYIIKERNGKLYEWDALGFSRPLQFDAQQFVPVVLPLLE